MLGIAGLIFMLVDCIVAVYVAVAFPLLSVTVIVVLPTAFGVIVNVLPLILASAIVLSEFVFTVTVPLFVPPIEEVRFAPPIYPVPLVGDSVTLVGNTLMLIVPSALPFDSFSTTLVVPELV